MTSPSAPRRLGPPPSASRPLPLVARPFLLRFPSLSFRWRVPDSAGAERPPQNPNASAPRHPCFSPPHPRQFTLGGEEGVPWHLTPRLSSALIPHRRALVRSPSVGKRGSPGALPFAPRRGRGSASAGLGSSLGGGDGRPRRGWREGALGEGGGVRLGQRRGGGVLFDRGAGFGVLFIQLPSMGGSRSVTCTIK